MPVVLFLCSPATLRSHLRTASVVGKKNRFMLRDSLWQLTQSKRFGLKPLLLESAFDSGQRSSVHSGNKHHCWPNSPPLPSHTHTHTHIYQDLLPCLFILLMRTAVPTCYRQLVLIGLSAKDAEAWSRRERLLLGYQLPGWSMLGATYWLQPIDCISPLFVCGGAYYCSLSSGGEGDPLASPCFALVAKTHSRHP